MKRIFEALAIAAALAGGCAQTRARPDATAVVPGHAECPVCVKNCDLACVDVTVDPDTPRCTCDGKTYYFCSEECRTKFEKQPAAYLSSK